MPPPIANLLNHTIVCFNAVDGGACAEEQLQLDLAGGAATHRLIRLAAVSRRSERLMGPARGLLVDG